jgi:RNA polymerase sigma-70 factor, ECF subfamily
VLGAISGFDKSMTVAKLLGAPEPKRREVGKCEGRESPHRAERILEVWRKADRFEGRSSVPTWLMSIARFKALSALRQRVDLELTEEIEIGIADPADDPETALQVKLRAMLLRRALNRLSSQHREIIDLVYYHEKSIVECVEILGIPTATVKTRMFYARKKLAELLKDV